ncbi:MAG: 4-(cytidine 5'-diphospho)-2-C-methyl-D-erythritol kinase [Elusimicrobia bacterium]|nr:4-(cytidine 5'-diphospho)-2-C-methyl-D-erythritol kinase [Elusimicrobiota bacterium]
MRLLAPAKINLYLQILKKRKDGYHSLETIFQTISLYDELELKETKQKVPRFSLKVIQNGSQKTQNCPPDQKNLVWKAAEHFFKEFNLNKSCAIILKKKIPIEAGLGGGSSDAAATLKGLAQLFLKSSYSSSKVQSKLLSCASRLGADVPFFLKGGCALGKGIGEKISAITPAPKFWCVIVKPEIGCSTKEAYAWWDETRQKKGLKLTENSNINIMLNSLIKQKGRKTWSLTIKNSFEDIVLSKIPELKKCKREILSQGAESACLSGSGSAFFGIVSSKKVGEEVKKKLLHSYQNVWLVQSL